MSVNFGFLTGYALACPFCDGSGHVGPHKMYVNETACGSDARMTYGLNVVENLRLELTRNEGAKFFVWKYHQEVRAGRCWWEEKGVFYLEIAETDALWSVKSVKGRSFRKKRKC